jgi:hypothetical protein
MTLEQLVAFLVTQSSPIAAVEAGRTSVAALEEKLRAGLGRFFGPGESGTTTFRFAGPLFYLRRSG